MHAGDAPMPLFPTQLEVLLADTDTIVVYRDLQSASRIPDEDKNAVRLGVIERIAQALSNDGQHLDAHLQRKIPGITLELEQEFYFRIQSLALAHFKDSLYPVPHVIVRQAEGIDGIASVHHDMTKLSLKLCSAIARVFRETGRKHLELEQDALQALQQRIVQFPGYALALGTCLVLQETATPLGEVKA